MLFQSSLHDSIRHYVFHNHIHVTVFLVMLVLLSISKYIDDDNQVIDKLWACVSCSVFTLVLMCTQVIFVRATIHLGGTVV